MMAEVHEPIVVEIDESQDVLEWLEANKQLVNHESITLIEHMLYENVKIKQVAVRLLHGNDQARLNLTVHPDEISLTLETIMNWALDVEEYELCERIKYLTNIIDDRESIKNND